MKDASSLKGVRQEALTGNRAMRRMSGAWLPGRRRQRRQQLPRSRVDRNAANHSDIQDMQLKTLFGPQRSASRPAAQVTAACRNGSFCELLQPKTNSMLLRTECRKQPPPGWTCRGAHLLQGPPSPPPPAWFEYVCHCDTRMRAERACGALPGHVAPPPDAVRCRQSARAGPSGCVTEVNKPCGRALHVLLSEVIPNVAKIIAQESGGSKELANGRCRHGPAKMPTPPAFSRPYGSRSSSQAEIICRDWRGLK